MLGNGRLEAMCFDGVKRLCHIRGKLRKKARRLQFPEKITAASISIFFTKLQQPTVWINQGDIILIGLRDYQDAKADVILKYTPDEARNLKTYGEFPETVRINETVTFVEDGFDEDIEFASPITNSITACELTAGLLVTLRVAVEQGAGGDNSQHLSPLHSCAQQYLSPLHSCAHNHFSPLHSCAHHHFSPLHSSRRIQLISVCLIVRLCLILKKTSEQLTAVPVYTQHPSVGRILTSHQYTHLNKYFLVIGSNFSQDSILILPSDRAHRPKVWFDVISTNPELGISWLVLPATSDRNLISTTFRSPPPVGSTVTHSERGPWCFDWPELVLIFYRAQSVLHLKHFVCGGRPVR
uniref:Eukaryotic translation initiation factor 4C n=1 Tax=Timema cristinae TaxID=61476 RepID=A0A7R9CGU5_TIMCR|nr:unnamed protein product [Timema cristinae]